MNNSQLFSRRSKAAVDFRPDDPAGDSPFAQLRRLKAHLNQPIAPAENITDCDLALDALREYTYRKIFGGTTHEEFINLDTHYPEVIDWMIAVHELERDVFSSRSRK